MKFAIASLLELIGIAVMAFGLWLLAPWLGVAVGGLGLLLAGLSIDPPVRAKPNEADS